jgi:SAM-dependent methyltransferase
MYLLYADDHTDLKEKTALFTDLMEPVLARLEAYYRAGGVSADFSEIPQYLQVCRWPFRKLEYTFALDILLRHLQPGDCYLDAGSGVTPLAHVLAGQGIHASACDGDASLIDKLRALQPDTIYGTSVAYAAQDLSALDYPSETFNAVSCISVLEHIPPPFDQISIREILRVVKPGGILVCTVDFTPAPDTSSGSDLRYRARRALQLVRRGDARELWRGGMRKIQARRVVNAGAARLPRSANQCFESGHLEQDIMPTTAGQEISSPLDFSSDIRSFTSTHAERFWNLEDGLYDNQGRRAVLPVAFILQKPASAISRDVQPADAHAATSAGM